MHNIINTRYNVYIAIINKAKMIKEKYFSIGSEEEAVEYFKKHLSDTIKEKFN